jgi:MoaA/NifB/PqqE/SkfB family radical SAM enzyme
MCNVWKNPSLPEEEISLKTLDKIPAGQGTINLTGGEPTLRADLADIVALLHPKTDKLEISSNGLLSQKLEPIIRKYPDIKIRFSLDGFNEVSNLIRGEKDGFDKKTKGLFRLQELGGTDLGFAITVQDDNAADLVGLFRYAEQHGFELSVSALHNGFQFHKTDNFPYDRLEMAHHIEELLIEQLRTRNVKNWFRAYMGLGLIAKVLGNPRLLPCKVGSDSVFLDPWADAFACNVRPDLCMGNLNHQTWDEIMHGALANEVRRKIAQCQQNCWMVGDAKAAMRHPRFTRLPRWAPFSWVLMNKARISLGLKINFPRYVNYRTVTEHASGPHRTFYLEGPGERKVQRRADPHYIHGSEYINR